jgi:hypothetical protein
MKTLSILTLAVAIATPALAADKPPPKSPPAETSATIGGKEVKIVYSAPSVRGRKIFGDLVPYGQVWRTGANAATTLTTEGELDLKGLKVPKGKYTLYSLPTEGGLTLIVNKQTGQWGTKYDESQDLGRVPMEVSKPAAPVEKMEIKLTGEGDKGTLTIAWENVSATLPIAAAK